jgi:molecular chaperone HtpG
MTADPDRIKPRIGKQVLETLTMGMYLNPLFVYREYVQNAADQIDTAVGEKIFTDKSQGEIDIIVDAEERSIRIEDNATGVKKSDVPTFLGDVARSPKRPETHKGFRGIGRLGGLGYCKRLVFETSYKGETTKSIMALDAEKLRDIIKDFSDTADAATVVSLITTIRSETEEKDAHYFRVRLEGVRDEGDLFDQLLDEQKVQNYLSMVAPVPFKGSFKFKRRIHRYFSENGIALEEYDVRLSLNNRQVFKAYSQEILGKNNEEVGSIIKVDFFKHTYIQDDRENLVVCWYGLSNIMNRQLAATNLSGGIRIKKNNITIGDENTLKELFESDRFNSHFIGEVHVQGPEFVPNARRDYFNENSTIDRFKSDLRNEFRGLVALARVSSELWSRKKDIESYSNARKSFDEFLSKEPISTVEVKAKKNKLERLETKVRVATATLKKLQTKYLDNANVSILYKTIIGDSYLEIANSTEDLGSQFSSFRLDRELARFDEGTRETVVSVFETLEAELWWWETENLERLKMKIVDKVVSSKSK